jgi:hypothetical protein
MFQCQKYFFTSFLWESNPNFQASYKLPIILIQKSIDLVFTLCHSLHSIAAIYFSGPIGRTETHLLYVSNLSHYRLHVIQLGG